MISFFIFAYFKFILPAYNSTKLVCDFNKQYTNKNLNFNYSEDDILKELEKLAKERNLTIGGFYISSVNKIFVADSNDLVATRHELCHKEQYLENRGYNCDEFWLKMLNEVECYVRQNF